MFVTDKLVLQEVVKFTIGTLSWSDHAPITLSLHISNDKPAHFTR